MPRTSPAPGSARPTRLDEAAEKQLVELMESLAERRKAAFSAGDKGTLEKINEALGSVNGAIKEIKDTAAIITDRVDQLNQVAEFVSKGGKKLIELPKVPPAISGVAGKLASAQGKISQVIELLDLVGPAKTELEGGLKYLKGVDMALEHFGSKSANPFIAVYVSAYLGPGIKNCMANIRSIAATISKQNRGLIEAGEGKYVNWQVEMGGEAMYFYLIQVYKVGPVAPVSDAAWEYLDDHRGGPRGRGRQPDAQEPPDGVGLGVEEPQEPLGVVLRIGQAAALGVPRRGASRAR